MCRYSLYIIFVTELLGRAGSTVHWTTVIGRWECFFKSVDITLSFSFFGRKNDSVNSAQKRDQLSRRVG